MTIEEMRAELQKQGAEFLAKASETEDPRKRADLLTRANNRAHYYEALGKMQKQESKA